MSEQETCDWCGASVEVMAMLGTHACCQIHLEYEHWEEVDDGETYTDSSTDDASGSSSTEEHVF